MARTASVERRTREPDITLTIDLDGTGRADIDTGIGFFDHMLDGFARHGLFDLNCQVKGDLEVDCHHTIEDTGIVLGQAIREAVGDKAGISRYGFFILPMDDALARSVLDISGRPYLVYNAGHLTGYIGTYDADLTEEFFRAVCSNAMITLHIDLLRGANTHHMCEAIFKSFGRALGAASRIVSDKVLSSKGSL